MKKKHIILVAVVAFLLVVYGINVYNLRTKQQPAAAPAVSTVSTTPTPPPEMDTIVRIFNVMQNTVPDAWFCTWTYDPAERTVWYIFADPAITPEVIQTAQQFKEETRERWESNKSSMIELQKEISRSLETSGFNDITVVVELRNPENKDEKWLAVANGIAGYDVVNGIDLLNGQG